jgi:hypothetical protein
MTITTDALRILDAQADIALDIIRDLRDMHRPSISLTQIGVRVIDYFDGDFIPTPEECTRMAMEISTHPSIRTALR